MVSYKNLLSSEEKFQTGRHSPSVQSLHWDDTRRPGIPSLFLYLHLIDFETVIMAIYEVIYLFYVAGDR